ncbi:hypothetical protein QQS21_010097 [Conoideocrella luteorostrata]|uniref:Uncharacterized protein n=1 Tax=Conoideocrella luteorostrata TaxID=1105319 RepID=A0AAJ0CFW0_9HYPO|nr:hypothetical protein QQS21_010097 [Conoideocrella luteorostrata]
MRFWLTFFQWTTLQYISLGQAHQSNTAWSRVTRGTDLGPPQPLDLKDSFVWRGEITRLPAMIEEDGGFYSRGFERVLDGEILTNAQLNKGSSLFQHAMGMSKEVTHYISTTTDPDVALSFASKIEGAATSYIYKIKTGHQMVDVNKSLKTYSPIASEKEQAAVGFIPWDQVEGWYEITQDERRFSGKWDTRINRLKFTKNDKYNLERYKSQEPSGEQLQLAGLPKQGDVDVPASTIEVFQNVWKRKPWKKYADMSTSDHLANFVWTKVCVKSGNENFCDLARKQYKNPSKQDPNENGDELKDGKVDPRCNDKKFSGSMADRVRDERRKQPLGSSWRRRNCKAPSKR